MKIIKKAYVEITNTCNQSCLFCPGTDRPKAFLTDSGFERIIMALRGNVGCLYFHVMGEPLLHPLLGHFLDTAMDADLPVNLTTNGRLLADAEGMLLGKPALRQVNVSLHSFEHNIAGSHLLDDVIRFAHMARGLGRPLVALRLWNERGGEGNPANRWMLERLEAEFNVPDVSAGQVIGGRGIALAKAVYLNIAEPFVWPGLDSPEVGGTGFCRGLRDQIAVLCDGTVVPCCLDGGGVMALGNLFDEPLAYILRSDRARSIVEGFSQRRAVEELCRRCGYRQRFD